jgi:hypothetical protein
VAQHQASQAAATHAPAPIVQTVQQPTIGVSTHSFGYSISSQFTLNSANSTASTRLQNLDQLPIRPTALKKVNDLENQTGLTKDEIITNASQSDQAYVDTRPGNNGVPKNNINVYQSKPSQGDLIRVTTNHDATAIISAGTQEQSQVNALIKSGTYVPVEEFFLGE